jgi:hypothetical protein
MNRELMKRAIESFMLSEYYSEKNMDEVEKFLTNIISDYLEHIESGDKR